MNRADALVQELNKTAKGRLTVFLGAAPGVGKTFAMLQRARELLQNGTDVVIGVVETHGRGETARQMEGLPALPMMDIHHQGQILKEFDLEAALNRRPSLILIDELAHSNGPGCLHAQRWQDVESLLKAGIDVYGTLNIQHLESINDQVHQLTGVRVRETVPDTLFDHLRDIRLIDLPPDDLLERLQQGKIYAPHIARQAMTGFFTPVNLKALRDLAIDKAGQLIDQDSRMALSANGRESAPMRKTVLIVLDGSERSEYMLRAGGRLAERRGARWIALCVVSRNAHLDDTHRARLDQWSDLTRRLGGEFEVVHHSDRIHAIFEVARVRQVTAILAERGHEGLIARLCRRTLADQLLHRGRQYEITLIASDDSRPAKSILRANQVPFADWAFAVLCSILAVLTAWAADSLLAFKDLSAIFLIAVLVVATRTGRSAATLAAVTCFLAYNYFFIEPRFTFEISAEQGIITVSGFLVTALMAGGLASRMREQLDALRAANAYGIALEQLTRQLSTATDIHAVLERGARALAQSSGARVWLRVGTLAETQAEFTLSEDPKIRHAASLCESTREECGRFTNTLAGAEWLFMPMPASNSGSEGVAGFCFPASQKSLSNEMATLLKSMTQSIGDAVMRTRLVNELESARVISETEKLRSALLSSVSHDLRSPLAAMVGAAETLDTFQTSLPPEDHAALLDTILQEGQRLDRYIQNLLDMTRLGHNGLALKREWTYVEDLVASAVQRLQRYHPGQTIEVQIEDGLPPLHAHPALIEQALFNVIENAAKFSPIGEALEIRVARQSDKLQIEVTDKGPGIPADERAKVFDMFYTMQRGDRGTQGTGLGLTIVQGIVGSHMGEVTALPGPDGQGTTLRICLPLSVEPNSSSVDYTE
ncbi:sensor histidine kinase [Limnobacter litoralis]|nr:sensor histidine kinase KdpD [Limnobacter litoralis]